MLLASVYVIFCVMVFLNPELFFYNPYLSDSNLEIAHEYGYPAQRVDYQSTDGTELFAWYTKPKTKKDKIVVFMHGNSYNVQEFFYKMIPFMEKGYGTFMPEYRGFGGVKGHINQKNLEADAIAAIKYLNGQGYKNKDIIVYGMSLGSHMATNAVYQLKKEGDFEALILEVPFDSLYNVVEAIVPFWMPLKWMITDCYDNIEMISKIDTKLLIMGGDLDATIPIHLAQNLYEHAVKPKKMIIYKGGKHNNLYNFRNYNAILAWLEGNEKSIK